MQRAVVPTTEPGVEHLHFASNDVLVGEFRCAPHHANFNSAGRIHNFVMAFPRSAVWIHRDDERPFVADPAIATIYNPGQCYERHRISETGDHSDYFAIAEPLARDIVSRFHTKHAEGDTVFRFSRAPVTAAAYYAQRQLVEHVRHSGGDALETEERVMHLIATVLGMAYRGQALGRAPKQRDASKGRQRALVESAKELMMSALFDNLSVGSSAEHLGVSPFYLCRTFRAATGMTLHEYRREMRLRVALGLTHSFRGNLSALAIELGFYSHSHFTTAFRAAFGIRPSRALMGSCQKSKTSSLSGSRSRYSTRTSPADR